jgi:ribosomal protein L19
MYPDLVISVSSELLKDKKSLFNGLKKGDQVKFEAKIMTLGNEFKMHHLHGVNIEKTGQFKELNDIVIRESALP